MNPKLMFLLKHLTCLLGVVHVQFSITIPEELFLGLPQIAKSAQYLHIT